MMLLISAFSIICESRKQLLNLSLPFQGRSEGLSVPVCVLPLGR